MNKIKHSTYIIYLNPQDASILGYIKETGKKSKDLIKYLSKQGNKVLRRIN